MRSVSESKRLQALELLSEEFSIDVNKLTKDQKYDIVVRTLKIRSKNKLRQFVFLVLVSIIIAITSVIIAPKFSDNSIKEIDDLTTS